MRRYRRERGTAASGSAEHREKMAAKTAESWRGREPLDQAGEKNPNWRGGEVSYSALHKWLRRCHSKTGACSNCGKEGKTDWAFLRHPDPYTREIADYRELCRSCHMRFDRGNLELQAVVS
jgi:hypothetical protein